MTRVRFVRAAADEAEEAVRWYDSRLAGLGGDFRAELAEAIARIAERPLAWPVSAYDRRTRQCLLQRFPYLIIFVVQEGAVTVAAVAHAKRRPVARARNRRSAALGPCLPGEA